MRQWRLAGGLLVVLVLVTACASYTTRLRDLRGRVAGGHLDEAIEMVAKVSKPGDLLYHLERGALLHYAGDYAASNDDLLAAEKLLDDLYTISVSQRALTFLLNDEAEAYRGQIHEGHFLHYYRLLNFHYQHRPGEAAVEARRLALRLASHRDELADDRALREMPFLQWLLGAVLEGNGEANDALIAYRWAQQGYENWSAEWGLPAPSWLDRALVRAAVQSGISPDEIPETRDVPGTVRLEALEEARSGDGELIVLAELGWAPQRQSEHLRIPIFKHEANWSGPDEALSLGFVLAGRYDYYVAHNAWSSDDVEIAYFLDVAVPILPDREPLGVGSCEVSITPITPIAPVGPIEAATGTTGTTGTTGVTETAEDAPAGQTGSAGETGVAGVPSSATGSQAREWSGPDHLTLVPVADVDGLVRRVYHKTLTGTLAKTFARALLKFVAKQQAEKELGTLAGILTNIAGVATEKADTRSWLLLPAQIQAQTIRLPAGRYRVVLEAYSHQGGKVGMSVHEVEIGEGSVAIVSWRPFAS